MRRVLPVPPAAVVAPPSPGTMWHMAVRGLHAALSIRILIACGYGRRCTCGAAAATMLLWAAAATIPLRSRSVPPTAVAALRVSSASATAAKLVLLLLNSRLLRGE